MPPYQTFLNPENLGIFWGNVKWILFFIAPCIMIWVAIHAVGMLIQVVKKALHEADQEEREGKKEDDEIEVYRY